MKVCSCFLDFLFSWSFLFNLLSYLSCFLDFLFLMFFGTTTFLSFVFNKSAPTFYSSSLSYITFPWKLCCFEAYTLHMREISFRSIRHFLRGLFCCYMFLPRKTLLHQWSLRNLSFYVVDQSYTKRTSLDVKKLSS